MCWGRPVGEAPALLGRRAWCRAAGRVYTRMATPLILPPVTTVQVT